MIKSQVGLLNKFKGSLIGALIGDCYGAFFEGSSCVRVEDVIDFIGRSIEKPATHEFQYTDDTAMSKSVADVLIQTDDAELMKVLQNHDIPDNVTPFVKKLARSFVKEYYEEPLRGYGGNVINVFEQLKADNCKDPHGPAKKQFGGSGSYGNGGAMRISPAALRCVDNTEEVLWKLVSNVTQITHSNMNAILGAYLQCSAVKLALLLDDSNGHLDMQDFVKKLCDLVSLREKSNTDNSDTLNSSKFTSKQTYSEKLNWIQGNILSENVLQETSVDDVVDSLGHDISALGSVPTALYAFLRSYSPIKGIDDKVFNKFQRTIIYAISLGGDTDTIASMAGAIAGAYYGFDSISPKWIALCEYHQQTINSAEKLYEKHLCGDNETDKKK